MNGLHVFFITGLISLAVFSFISYTLQKKGFKKVKHFVPAVSITGVLGILTLLQIFFIKDGWVIMGNAFFAISIASGALIGTFIINVSPKKPFI